MENKKEKYYKSGNKLLRLSKKSKSVFKKGKVKNKSKCDNIAVINWDRKSCENKKNRKMLI